MPEARPLLKLAALLSILALVAPAAGGPASQNYRIERFSVAAATATASSPGYHTSLAVAQESPDGVQSSCTAGVVNGLGFWSIRGERPAPLILMVRQSSVDPDAVELSWSGVFDLFRLFRDGIPDDLLDPANLILETGACGTTDADAPTAGVVFYRVVSWPPAAE